MTRMSWKTIKEAFIVTDEKNDRSKQLLLPSQNKNERIKFLFTILAIFFLFLRIYDDQKSGLEGILGHI